ncbi:MAG: hypothetical protein P8M70_01155 [Verrucomicrobiota bacterium]|nr:hypothetical protein [Verrucomicrobiota bacterium]
MKNYAAIIIVLTAYDLSGQALGLSRFLFEPIIRPLDWRPPQDYNATRGRGGHHGVDNRITPNVHGSASADDYGNNPVDFNGTFDRNALTYNLPFGQIYNGSNLPIEKMAIGNPLNSWNERWHSSYDPDIVRQNPGRFTPGDNRYNPNLTLHGNIVESPWEFFASPQMNMTDPLNTLRHPALENDLNYLTTEKSDGSFFINDHRLTTMNWDTIAHEETWALLGPTYNTVMERVDGMEIGGYFQDGETVPGSGDAWFSCPGANAQHLAGTPAQFHHTWEKRHFSSLTRAGLDAKRSIPMDGIYGFLSSGVNAKDVHWFTRGGGVSRESWHWGWAEGNGADKPIFNAGMAWVFGGPGGALPLGGGGFGGAGIGGPAEGLEMCSYYNATAAAPNAFTGTHTIDGGAGINERYGAGAIHSQHTGNNSQTVRDANNAILTGYDPAVAYQITGTTSPESAGREADGTPYNFVRENATGVDRLAGHPLELSGSGLSPWDQAFGYDLSRFFGDFYIRPSVHTVNLNDSTDPNVNTGLGVDRRASQHADTGFMNPIDPQNQVSTRSLANILEMGDLRTKIRHINRFPQSGLDYLFQVNYSVGGAGRDRSGAPDGTIALDQAGNPLISNPGLAGPNNNRLPVYVQ